MQDDFPEALGQAIRRARRARGWTLRQLSEASGGLFKPSTAAAYERGERAISVRRFCEFAAFMGVRPSELLDDVLAEHESGDQLTSVTVDDLRVSLPDPTSPARKKRVKRA